MIIRRILVAVDGSDASVDASNYAIDMAEKFEASLTVLFVVAPATYIDFGYAKAGTMNDIKSTKKELAQNVVDKVNKKAMERGVSVKTDIIVGITSVVKEIVEYAEKHKMDLIITGSRGMTGFKKKLLGSVASGVVTYAHCPVLVAK